MCSLGNKALTQEYKRFRSGSGSVRRPRSSVPVGVVVSSSEGQPVVVTAPSDNEDKDGGESRSAKADESAFDNVDGQEAGRGSRGSAGSSGSGGGSGSGSRAFPRRSSVVVIPPMQVCPGDLLVYSKALTHRGNFQGQYTRTSFLLSP